MKNKIVKNWFGSNFNELHPLLQKLHIYGGELSGDVSISYGSGLSGLIGKRLAKKMQLPSAGNHQLLVSISHTQAGLHWNRAFNDNKVVESLFAPTGNKENGYWLETTGPLLMKLTVDIVDGGWVWRCLSIKLFGLPVPLWLIPHARAFKYVKNNKYIFQVSFSYPLLGSLVSYKGELDARYNDRQGLFG